MPESSDAVKEVLLEKNEEFQRLAKKHQELEERLTILSRQDFLERRREARRSHAQEEKASAKRQDGLLDSSAPRP